MGRPHRPVPADGGPGIPLRPTHAPVVGREPVPRGTDGGGNARRRPRGTAARLDGRRTPRVWRGAQDGVGHLRQADDVSTHRRPLRRGTGVLGDVSDHRLDADRRDRLSVAAVLGDHDCRGVCRFDSGTSDLGMAGVMAFEPVLLARVNKPDGHRLEGYRADGGYAAFERTLRNKQPADVVNTVKDSGLRGRGGAGFPCGVKWTFLPKDHPGPIYLCVNADESEPCTYNNRILMEEDPHQVLEGILLACYATRASTAYIYIRYEYGRSARALQRAIDELYTAGLLGRNILGKDFHLDCFIHRGAGAYICGEETGLIESLEGKRAWPRIKPPFPAVEGAFRKPTVVNNIETLACVTHIIDRGPDWFKSMGAPPDPKNPRDAGSYGPKLYCISGHVNKPGCYEGPLGITCRELIEEFGGGVWKGRKGKVAIPGGISMGLLTEAEFDTKLDFNALGKVGCL